MIGIKLGFYFGLDEILAKKIHSAVQNQFKKNGEVN